MAAAVRRVPEVSRRARGEAVGASLAVAAACLATALVWAPRAVSAQIVALGLQTKTYSFDDATVAGIRKIRMFAAPFAVGRQFERVSVGFAGAYARATATGPAGEEASLAGLADTELAVSYRPGPDWLVLTASATLPTGQGSLTTQESFVAAFVAAELLPFPIESWGSGGETGGDVAVATQAGAWGVGFAAGYRVAHGYEPVPDQPFTYTPGNQIQLRVAADRNVGESGTLSVLLGLQHFADDDLQGVNLFKPGTRFEAVVSYAFPIGLRSSALVYGGLNHRSNGTVLTDEPALAGATDTPSQRLFLTGTHLRFPLGRGSAILPRAELMVFRAEDGASQGWVSTLGPSADLRISGNASTRQVFLAPSVVLRFGKVIVQEGSETDFTGWEAGVTLRVVPAR